MILWRCEGCQYLFFTNVKIKEEFFQELAKKLHKCPKKNMSVADAMEQARFAT